MARQLLTLHVAAAEVPQAERLLELAGAEALSLADAGDEPVLEPPPDSTPLWPRVALRAQFPAGADLPALSALLRDACSSASDVRIAALEDDDWRRTQLQDFPARRIGERLWLGPAGDDSAPSGPAHVRLRMGLAFGTGQHPTTALCLEWLEAHVRGGATILDYGCGSGVLAIAALALGASRAWAVDNDPQARAASRDNALLNGLDERLWIGEPETLPAVAVDVLAANILAGPLESLAPTFAARVRSGGCILLSGILERQLEDVVAAYAPFFESFGTTARDGWVCVAAERRKAS